MIILEQKYSGKDSHSMDFAHGRVDSIGDCCYCRRNRIVYFPGAAGGREIEVFGPVYRAGQDPAHPHPFSH